MKYNEKTLFKLSFGLSLGSLLLAFSCNSSVDAGVDDDCDDPPPPPPLCEGYMEYEPNDTEDDANYVSLLPELNPEPICGTFYDWEPGVSDSDFYYFFLSPSPGVDVVSLSLVLETDEAVVPAIYLSQTVYDNEGYSVGYTNLGIFYGAEGEITILDFPIPYDFLESNDLFIRVDGIYPPDFEIKEYKIEYWNF